MAGNKGWAVTGIYEEILKNLEDVTLKNTQVAKFVADHIGTARDTLNTQAWHTIVMPLDIFGNELPSEIKLARLYFLKSNTKAPKERHLNSTQRLISIQGRGRIHVQKDDGEWTFDLIGEQTKGHLVPVNTWHYPESDEDLWVTVAFHTATASEIIDQVEPIN